MKRLAALLVFLCCCIAAAAQSGTMTAYERGRYEIANTALKMVTEPMNSDQQLLIALVYTKMKKEVVDIFDETTVMENIVFKYCGFDSSLATDANYLPNFQYPDRNLIGNYPRSWRETGKWYREERLKLETTKTSEDRTREKERNNYKKGVGLILDNITTSFISWAMRRDYEDDTSYHVRLKRHATEVFDSLAYKFCDEAWKTHMSIVRGEYDYTAGTLSLRYFDNRSPESEPLQGSFPTDVAEAAYFNPFDIDVRESHAFGLSFRDGLCYPSTLVLNYRGRRDEIEVKLAPDDHFRIEGESVRIEGTKRFVDSVTPYLRNHVFDYSVYAASRTYRTGLYNRLFEVYGKYVRVAGADPGMRLEKFMPEGPHFSSGIVESTLDDFDAFCLVSARKWLYGRFAAYATNMVSLREISDVLKKGSIEECLAAINRTVDAHLHNLAGRITPGQADGECSRGELADGAALILGMHTSGISLDMNAKAKSFVEASNPLSSRYNANKRKWRGSRTPYISFLLELYPDQSKTQK